MMAASPVTCGSDTSGLSPLPRQAAPRAREQIPVIVISLPDAAERRRAVTDQLDQLGLTYRVFNAVDGRRLSDEHRALVDPCWRQKRRGEALRPAEIGCALSHALVYRMALEEAFDDCIVLEDDARLTPAFARLARRDIDLPAGVDLVSLHYYRNQFVQRGRLVDLGNGFRVYRPFGRLLGTCAYYVTRRGAAELLKAGLPIWTQADWPLDPTRSLNGRGLEPPVVIHDEAFPSQLQEFASRSIPWPIRLARFAVLPTMLFPERFGSVWKARYAWAALIFKLRAYCFARRVRCAPTEHAPHSEQVLLGHSDE